MASSTVRLTATKENKLNVRQNISDELYSIDRETLMKRLRKARNVQTTPMDASSPRVEIAPKEYEATLLTDVLPTEEKLFAEWKTLLMVHPAKTLPPIFVETILVRELSSARERRKAVKGSNGGTIPDDIEAGKSTSDPVLAHIVDQTPAPVLVTMAPPRPPDRGRTLAYGRRSRPTGSRFYG